MTKLLKEKMIKAMLTRSSERSQGNYVIQEKDGTMRQHFLVPCCSFLYGGNTYRDYMMVDLFGQQLAPNDRSAKSEYWRACKLWCEVFPELFMKQSWKERREVGAIIKLTKGKFTNNRLSAFLVGHRNLTEYNTMELFLKCVDSGIPKEQAAFICQMFYGKNGRYTEGFPHAIFDSNGCTRYSVESVIAFIKNNPIFYPTDGKKRVRSSSFMWRCRVVRDKHLDSNGQLVGNCLKPTSTGGGAWGSRVSAYSDTDIIAFFKEHLK